MDWGPMPGRRLLPDSNQQNCGDVAARDVAVVSACLAWLSQCRCLIPRRRLSRRIRGIKYRGPQFRFCSHNLKFRHPGAVFRPGPGFLRAPPWVSLVPACARMTE